MPAAKNITGRQTSAGGGEETVNLSLDGSTASATIAISTGTILVITDWVCSAEAACRFRLQQTNDGVTFFDLGLLRISADGTVGMVGLGTGRRIVGGQTVAIRVRDDAAAATTLVQTTICGYTE